MKKNYICPICRSSIRVGDYIVLSAKSPVNETGLIFLSPEIGNYSKLTHPDFQLKPKEAYKLYCPVCHATLNEKDKENMAKVILEEEGEEYDIFFSNIPGEEITYRVTEHEVEKFGESERYAKYFDLPEQYKKYLK